MWYQHGAYALHLIFLQIEYETFYPEQGEKPSYRIYYEAKLS